MRVALVSDVHANTVALDAVIADAMARGLDALWNMGDLVGYGPEPDAVTDTLRALSAKSVRGNHDAAASGALGVERFNPIAALAIQWTAANITPETTDYLRGLPETLRIEPATLAHGTLSDPLWEYLETYDEARGHFERQETWLSVTGHTHRPVLIYQDPAGNLSSRLAPIGEPFPLGEEGRWCINPGSVGQPRDGDPRASYAILDLGAASVTYLRVTYDIAATQHRMRELGLAEPLIARLALGR